LLDYAPLFSLSSAPYIARRNTNLTCLAHVRSWVNSQSSTDDALLNRLIAEASRTIMNYLQRADTGLTTITEIISGRGERRIQLRSWPVIEVSSLSINGINVPASTGPTVCGYFLEPDYGSVAGSPQNLGIVGGGAVFGDSGGYASFGPGYGTSRGPFARGVGNIAVGYSFGYCIQNEALVVPGTPFQSVPYAPYGPWSGDNGVPYAGGAPLTPVTGSPSQGHYVPPTLAGESPVPYYQFSAADAGASVQLNYNYVPADVEQACIEVVAERYRYRSRIGQISQSIGGQETAAYLVKDGLTAAIKLRLDPYKLDWAG
jgi:hypothetical protein